MNIREKSEKIEKECLSSFAALSCKSKGRKNKEDLCSIRTIYQQDRDRVIHSEAFRMLKHKTQVFLSPKDDSYRTRLTHTLEVSQIARTIARALSLNEDLTEAIALAHDLGHTPFGHAGERALNDIMPTGFRHCEQGVRIVEVLEKFPRGLDLSYEVKDGILHHTSGEQASTMEGRVVRIADRIAFINHDIDDAVRAKVITEDDIPQSVNELLGVRRSRRINTLVLSLVENTQGDNLKMSDEVQKQFDILNDFMFERVYNNGFAMKEEDKIPYFINDLFVYLKKNPQRLDYKYQVIERDYGIDRAVCDFISSLSDNHAIKLFEDFYIPKAWNKV